MFFRRVLTLFKGKIGDQHGQCSSLDLVDKQHDSSLAEIVVFGDCNQNVEAGIRHLENLLDRDFVRKEFREDIIRKLSESQVCYKTKKNNLIS